MIMAFLPYEHFTTHVSLSPQEVQKRLAEKVGSESYWTGYSREQKPYTGQIAGDDFKISKNIRYRDSLLPVIFGEIRDDSLGSAIEIRMRPALVVLMVLACGIVVPAALGLFLLVSSLTDPGFSGAWWPPFVLALIWYTIFNTWFRLEVVIARAFLDEVLADPLSASPARTVSTSQVSRSWVGGTRESSRYGKPDQKQPGR
jgi:hypothetical protein